MRTETIEIFSFEELSDEAKENAIENYRDQGHDYVWTEEWLDSLEEFASRLSLTIQDWTIGPYSHSYINWNHTYQPEPEVEEFTGLRLRTWLINNYLDHFATGKYYSKFIGDEHRSRHSKIFIEYDNCPLTGYMGDNSLIQPILDFIKEPDGSTLEDIVNSCMESFIAGYTADCEYQDSDEFIKEELIQTEQEFIEDGSLY